MTRLTVISQHRHLCSLRRQLGNIVVALMRSQSCHCVIDAFSRISHLGTLPRTIFNEVSKFGASDDASTWKKELVDLLAKSKQAAADDMKEETKQQQKAILRRASTRSLRTESPGSESSKALGRHVPGRQRPSEIGMTMMKPLRQVGCSHRCEFSLCVCMCVSQMFVCV